MTHSTDGIPPGCLDVEAVTARMGWKSPAVVRTMSSRAKRRRDAGTSRPGDMPPPDGYAGPRRRPYWREETITAWAASRPSAVREADNQAGGKRCSKCRELKPEAEFYTHTDTRTNPPTIRLTAKCKACHLAVAQDWNERNIERRRATARAYGKANRKRERARRYRLTEAELIRMETEHNGRCRICGEETERLVIDHCHTTGAVRGLLCVTCNLGIGYFKDQPGRLVAAALYLTAAAAS